MNFNKFLPLTETTYYILISLLQPLHGYAVMQRVEELSEGKVRIAAGTLYGAFDNLSKQKIIKAVPTEEKRRKVYIITDLGKELLNLECERMQKLVEISRQLFLQGGNKNEKV
jgi:DNA-binding PadR family transcriptional regulator